MPKLIEKTDLFRVGYALPKRKIDVFMVESFINYAKEKGIGFIPIDISKPLTNQGPFDCIIHKLYGLEWDLNLNNFIVSHPNVTIVNPPSAVQHLFNRISMLEPVIQLNIPQLNVPNQILIQDSESLKSVELTNGLTFPVMVKPLLADGSATAHNMSLVFNREGLTKKIDVNPPMVLQQFVNHGGIMFKVYVAGEYVKCVSRSSLPDVSHETMEKMTLDSVNFSKISSGVIGSDNNSGEKIKMPAQEFVDEVAKRLRVALGLHLFNFDMIKDDKRDDGYLVVDINYFPGYEKLPNYESLMTDFFLNIKKSQELKINGSKK